MENPTQAIKTMKLYSHTDRVYNELKELGYKDDEPLKVEDVNKFDNYHYHGTDTVQGAIDRLGLSSSSKCIDVGSGLGGPARYIASSIKCHVTAIELQKDLHETAEALSKKCGLGNYITHVCGNFLDMELEADTYDALISILVFLHITEKEKLFKHCAHVLKAGGKMYIEDQYVRGNLTDDDKRLMINDVYAPKCNTRVEYVELLNNAGFDVEFTCVSDDWTDFAKRRVDEWTANKERHIRVHGEQIYKEQLHFFTSISTLYSRGNLGGCKIVATLRK